MKFVQYLEQTYGHIGGAHSVMVNFIENGHGEKSSNLERSW